MVATQVGVELESLECHDGSGRYQARFDTETTPASMAIIATVVEATDAEPMDVEPLQETIETDALDELVGSGEITHGTVKISFVFEGSRVTVTSDGVVTVAPPDWSPNPAATEEEMAQ